ncbi:MAG: DUF4998 domain-containing protein [Mangrovibacterium sp.]|nr:DUF4998 domain-containing protein [Mangrovibacterium sp.]
MKRILRRIGDFAIWVIFLSSVSCSDMYDNVREYAEKETIYVEKLDGIINIQVGYERVEIDLLEAGRIPASHIRMGKAKKTVIECPDFTEPDHRRVIDSICSWVNITGLTQLKTYQFTIYTQDEYGNLSMPLKAEARPYTAENVAALSLVAPSITESTAALLVEWKEHLSAKTQAVYRYGYQYTDKDGEVKTASDRSDLPSFFVENVLRGTDIPVDMNFLIVPTIANSSGAYLPILDTITWQTQLVLKISENAKPAVFLKEPSAVIPVDLNQVEDNFPLSFAWTKVAEAENYVLKFSTDPDFPEAESYTVNVGSVNQYTMDAATGSSLLGDFPRVRSLNLYWTVSPADEVSNIETQTRRLECTRLPSLIGRWQFDDPSDVGKASLGADLVLHGSGFTPVDGPSAKDKAVSVANGSYLKCLHGLTSGFGDYTVMLHVRIPREEGVHALIQTNLGNQDDHFMQINKDGRVNFPTFAAVANNYTIGIGHWHRIFLTVSDGKYSKCYIDGEYTRDFPWGVLPSYTRQMLDPEGVLFFSDDNGEDNEMEVADIAIWDMALEEDELLQFNGLSRMSKAGITAPYATPSHVAGGDVVYFLDNSHGTTWYSNLGLPHYIVLDLGTQRNVGRLVLYTSTWGAANPKTVQVLVGLKPDPNGSWTQVGEVVRQGPGVSVWGGILSFDFPDGTASTRYLKILMPDYYLMNALNGYSIFEKTN